MFGFQFLLLFVLSTVFYRHRHQVGLLLLARRRRLAARRGRGSAHDVESLRRPRLPRRSRRRRAAGRGRRLLPLPGVCHLRVRRPRDRPRTGRAQFCAARRLPRRHWQPRCKPARRPRPLPPRRACQRALDPDVGDPLLLGLRMALCDGLRHAVRGRHGQQPVEMARRMGCCRSMRRALPRAPTTSSSTPPTSSSSSSSRRG